MSTEDRTTSSAEPGAPGSEPGDAGVRAAVVTEVGGSVGWGIAQTLAGLGYAVHVTDLDGRLAARAAAQLGDPCFGSALDVRSLPACRAAASRTRRRFGSLGVWANAAPMPESGPAWELDERSRQQVLDRVLVGTINGTLAALEVMRPTGKGDVINVIELSALVSRAGQAVYSAAQQGALAFSHGTLADLRAAGLREVNVSCLCPTRRLAGNRGRLESALVDLLEHPRPVMAVPRWRGALVRARPLWPSGALGSGLLSALADPTRPGRRSGRSQSD
ncbi:MAG TPA: SDR family NAD(P)-dependent oxidoreductase [Solirubrobacteraceae bacterium]|nr:SDR family NAD(P)-dependent oxidoreductase [Solirubrobacteraceae bacterium]